ncbi:MAG: hypothetical protein IIY81_06975, partial [Lachnospiraceae bacterium]|nr:hypothetical protein [Lachnospiraceae bacterium]
MKWYEKAVFYHIYPLGLCGCPFENDGVTSENHFKQLNDWTTHIDKLGCNAIYIGPLFESATHGYDTTDYKKVDRRLGTNADFKEYVKNCHDKGIHVIVDGVFNHVGRKFFAFEDLKQNRENSRYKDWFCNVNFYNNNEYNDGFSYDNWGGYNVLVKLNQRNPEVKNYIFDIIRYWVQEFDIDGIRLDAADVLDHDFMHEMRNVANTVKEDFWLMGEVIHGDYSQWANDQTLHSVTNYELHKALYSGHNDHNYFEIAHSIQRSLTINGNTRLYTFVDNHDVERIATKLSNKANLIPVHILYYGLPGIPSIYYGSEFGIEGKKEQNSDASLRPALNLSDYATAYTENSLTQLICKLGMIHKQFPELTEGRYEQLYLTNRQFAYGRILDDTIIESAISVFVKANTLTTVITFFNEHLGVRASFDLHLFWSLHVFFTANFWSFPVALLSALNHFLSNGTACGCLFNINNVKAFPFLFTLRQVANFLFKLIAAPQLIPGNRCNCSSKTSKCA